MSLIVVEGLAMRVPPVLPLVSDPTLSELKGVAGARPTLDLDHRSSMLLRAVADGDLALVDAFLEAGVPAPLSAQQRTATALAALCGQEHVLQRLIDVGFDDPLQPDENGRDALSLALLRGHASCVRLLLPFLPGRPQEERAETPLMLAAKNGHPHSLRVLLPVSDPLALTASGDDALSLAAAKGRSQCVEILCALPDGPAQKPGRLEKAIYRAAQRGHAAVLSVLLKQPRALQAAQGAHPPYHATPLLEAVNNGHAQCVEVLLPFSGLVRTFPPQGTGAFVPLHAHGPASDKHDDAFTARALSGEPPAPAAVPRPSLPAPSHGLTPMRAAIQLQNWACADLLAVYSPPAETLEAFSLAGVDGMPQWACAQEREALGQALAEHPHTRTEDVSPEASSDKALNDSEISPLLRSPEATAATHQAPPPQGRWMSRRGRL